MMYIIYIMMQSGKFKGNGESKCVDVYLRFYVSCTTLATPLWAMRQVGVQVMVSMQTVAYLSPNNPHSIYRTRQHIANLMTHVNKNVCITMLRITMLDLG